MRNYIKGLDYIRAFSILAIVFYHYTYQYEKSIGHVMHWNLNVSWGHMAVNTLFVLTAYLTIRNWDRRGFSFLYKRFVRLYPSFIICIFITTGFMYFFMPSRLCTIKDIIINFTMFPNQLGAKPVDGVYWALSTEIIFYVMIMVFMQIKDEGKFIKCLFLWGCVSIIISLCGVYDFNNLIIKCIRVFGVTERSAPFIIGCLIALKQKMIKWNKLVPTLIVSSIAMLVSQGLKFTIWTLLWGCIIYVVVKKQNSNGEQGENIITRLASFISSISYPLYLLHQYIGYSIINMLEHAGYVDEWIVLIPFLVSILLAYLVHRYIEVPSSKFLLSRKGI